MIRNFPGCYVLISDNVAPTTVMLSHEEQKSYSEREAIVGLTKTNLFTFGADCKAAIPCTTAALEFIALNFPADHPFGAAIKSLCARIAVNGYAGGDDEGKPGGDGGDKVTQKPVKPRKPRGGLAVPVPVSNGASA